MKTNLTSLFKEILVCNNTYFVDHFFKQKVYFLLDNEKWRINVGNVKITIGRLRDVIVGRFNCLELKLIKKNGALSF